MKHDQTALEARVQTLMQASMVPGVSLAVVRNGAVNVVAIGVKDIVGGELVNHQTVFDAASLSKPMVAYAVLQLVDADELDLDEPLLKFSPPVVPGDVASASITARHILTHTSGLPNSHGKEPLRIYFRPGSRFSYSGIGFAYLQSAVQAITGEPLETTMTRLVFEPLGMHSSSFEWQERFRNNFASPHEGAELIDKHRPHAANASYSLQTTAADYGAFVEAVLKGNRLQKETHRLWLTPEKGVPRGDATHLESTHSEIENDIAWGLGWGLELTRGTFFQWGKMPGMRALVMGSLIEQSAVVLFTNSNTGLRLMNEVLRSALPGEHPAVRWLEECVWE